jgi:hypothetical protein
MNYNGIPINCLPTATIALYFVKEHARLHNEIKHDWLSSDETSKELADLESIAKKSVIGRKYDAIENWLARGVGCHNKATQNTVSLVG